MKRRDLKYSLVQIALWLSLIWLIIFVLIIAVNIEKTFGEEQLVNTCEYPEGNTHIIESKTEETATTGSFSIEKEEVKEYLGEYTITAYCSCEICCGSWHTDGGEVIGASNEVLYPNKSVASASNLPFGTSIEIDGFDITYVVQDRTAVWIMDRYDNKIIDIYVSSHSEIDAIGKQTRKVWINTQ